MGQSLQINETLGYCLYVDERVHSSYTETRMEYLSSSLFTFGEPNCQYNVIQLLLTNTIAMLNENSTVER